MQNIQHFIWDFDGTLFDTYPIIIGSLRSVLQEHGHDCDPLEAMKLMLTNIPTARNHYADRYGISRDVLSEAHADRTRKAIAKLTAPPFPGVREVLERICATGRHNYIYTHRDDAEIILYLKEYGLYDFFEEVIGPTSPHFALKPAPDSVLYLMEKYGMSTGNTAMVGDRECDLASGRNAGIKAVHFVCAEVPEDLACDWRINRFSEMLELL